jgi:mono/diheme cytochrome c family protein
MRMSLLVQFLVLSMTPSCVLGEESPYATTVLLDRPVVYLRFDRLDDTDRTRIRDLTGRHHAELTGQLVPAAGVPGTGGDAATFDGSTTVVTIPHANALELDSLSVEFWLRTTQPFNGTFWPGSATLVSKATPGAGTSDWTINAASTEQGKDQGRLLAESGPAGKPSDLFLFSPVGRKLNDDRWHHVVWTRTIDGANRMYLDGELAAQGNDGGGPISNARSVQIGGDSVHEGGRHFAGRIDEVAIYDRPLALERVRAHYMAATIQGKLPPAATRVVDFVADIQPIFQQHCFECHGPGHSEGGLTLASRAAAFEGGDTGTVIEPGASVVSRLVHFTAGIDEDRIMPPEGKRLTEDQIGLIRAWIDQGAAWPASADIVDPKSLAARKHWSFQPIKRPTVPDVRLADRVANPIDAFILKRLEDGGLEGGGLEGGGLEGGRLEGGRLKPADVADRTTLLRRATFDLIGLPPEPKEIAEFLDASDRETAYVAVVERLLESPHYGERWGRHWLDVVRYADSAGFELDTFYNHAWQYRDYVIRSLNDDKPFDRFILEQLAADELWPDDESLRFATGLLTVGPFHYEGGIARPEAARYESLTDIADTTGTAFLGLTIGCARCHTHKYDVISQKDYFGLHAILAPGRPWDLERQKRIDNSSDRRKPQTWVVKNTESAPVTHVLRRGELSTPGATVVPAIVRSLPGGGPLVETESSAFQQRRSTFARWLIARENPLTARVLANRVWQWHFGRPLVLTPDDFGLQGQPPTHPELLDFLAGELIDHDWKLKHLHRLIMTSSTYQAASRGGIESVGIDPTNRWLSHFPRRRLEAEIIWDNLHAVSGTLNREQFGPPVAPPIEKSALEAVLNTNWNVTEDKTQWTRRGMYVVVRRSLRVPFFETFNTADSTTSCVRRDATVVSPQALTLLNGAVAGEQARAFAGRLLRERGSEPTEIVERAWLLAFGRRVDDAEREQAMKFLASREEQLASRNLSELVQPIDAPDFARPALAAAMVELCLALMNTNEFIYID